MITFLDNRLSEIIPGEDYESLKAKADALYARIEQEAPEAIFKDMLDLLLIMREVEMCLLEDRFRDRYTAYAYVARGTAG